jgi:hypothetical protein
MRCFHCFFFGIIYSPQITPCIVAQAEIDSGVSCQGFRTSPPRPLQRYAQTDGEPWACRLTTTSQSWVDADQALTVCKA